MLTEKRKFYAIQHASDGRLWLPNQNAENCFRTTAPRLFATEANANRAFHAAIKQHPDIVLRIVPVIVNLAYGDDDIAASLGVQKL